MRRTEIRITGFGGQGVVLSGYILGRAHAVHEGMHATMMQSFGPEARGSACSATLVLSDEEVLYPYVEAVDVLVAMSSDGYETHRSELRRNGTLVFEEQLVRPRTGKGQKAFGVPSTRIAESLGRIIVQNIVMLGFVAASTELVSRDAMREAVRTSVPAGTEDLNLRAFDAGWDHFQEAYHGTPAERLDGELVGQAAKA